MSRLVIRLLMAVVTVAGLCGCEHKELCYLHPHGVELRVDFDWSEAPDATPGGMCVFFYPVTGDDDGRYRRFDFSGRHGGTIELPEGRYRVITYNNDTSGSLFGGLGLFETHQAYTRESSVLEPVLGPGAPNGPLAPGVNERVVLAPDMLWGASVDEITVGSDTNRTLTLHPRELVCAYTCEIRNVEGLRHVTAVCGSLSSMSPALALHSGQLHRECVTLPFEARKADDRTIVGQFYTFGHHADNEAPHRLLFYVWMDDGTKYYFGADSPRFDVTSQIHTATDPRRVHITIDGLDLPALIDTGTPIAPSIDDWLEIHHPIYL